jgi:hypothetical protein
MAVALLTASAQKVSVKLDWTRVVPAISKMVRFARSDMPVFLPPGPI